MNYMYLSNVTKANESCTRAKSSHRVGVGTTSSRRLTLRSAVNYVYSVDNRNLN